MGKNYLLLVFVFAFSHLSFGINPNGITGNLSICLPGPMTTQLYGSGTPASINPWISSNPVVATVSSTGLVTATGVFGTTTITYQDNLGNSYAQNIYVSSYPTMSSVSGNYTMCSGGMLQLEGSVFPNQTIPWQSSDTTIATVDSTGLVIGMNAGVANITYMNLGGCTVTRTITVNPLLSPMITCGTWQPNQTKRFDWGAVPGATTYTIFYNINGGAYAFGATGNILTFTVSNVLQTDSVSIYVTPSGPVGNCFEAGTVTCQSSSANCPEAGTSGSITVCDNDSSVINLFEIITGEDTGGVWTRIAGTGGIFNAGSGTFIPAGATTSAFNYTVTGTTPCPNDSSLATITINAAPNAGVLSGVQNICVGFTTSFSSTTNGGVWSSSNPAVATVNPVTGIITGVAAGVTNMTYTVPGIAPCGNDTATRMVTVNAQPEQPSIQGFQGICVGSWTIFTANPPGGTWSSSNNAVAMVDSTGFILGNSAGVCTISYTISGSGGCADRTATRNIMVSTTPTIVLASAPDTANQTVCENTPVTPIIYNIGTFNAQDALAISLPAGVSSSYSAGVLTISGTPVASGTFPYSAIAVGPCGSDSLSGTITVNPSASTTMFCDPSGVTSPNSVRIDWANIVGVTSYQYAYSIDNGPVVNGATNISNHEISDIQPGQSVMFTLTNAVGVSCFQPISVTCSNLASESFEIDTFQSFPNPVTDILKIISATEISQLEITNTLGERILRKNFASKTVEVDMSGLAPGIYLVKVSANRSMKTIKIIKD